MGCKNFLLIGVIVIVIAIGSFAGGIWYDKNASSDDKEELKYFKENYLWRGGWSKGFGSFNIFSLDAGKNWYAVKTEAGGGKKIVGPSEDIFPGLVKHLNAWDALVEGATKHGPISLGNPTEREIQLLKNAGFSVQKTE